MQSKKETEEKENRALAEAQKKLDKLNLNSENDITANFDAVDDEDVVF